MKYVILFFLLAFNCFADSFGETLFSVDEHNQNIQIQSTLKFPASKQVVNWYPLNQHYFSYILNVSEVQFWNGSITVSPSSEYVKNTEVQVRLLIENAVVLNQRVKLDNGSVNIPIGNLKYKFVGNEKLIRIIISSKSNYVPNEFVFVTFDWSGSYK